MSIHVKVNLQPMRTPNHVLTEAKPGLRQEGFKETPKYALSELSEEALDALCVQFRKDVFEKAGKVDKKVEDLCQITGWDSGYSPFPS